MYRASVKIERLTSVTRRTVSTEEGSADLLIQVKGITPLDAINRAIRLLTSERDNLTPIGKLKEFDDDEEFKD